MNIETNRLSTFANWPASAPVDPIRIAKAGFFYTGEGTEVQCFSCGGKISQWNYGDQVMTRHRNMEPNCAFVQNSQLSGNIPLVLRQDCPNDNMVISTATQQNNADTHDYGLTEDDAMYRTDLLRLLSFTNWEDNSVSRESLASAGFYHAGEGRLRCAWCGGELAPFRNFGSLGHPLDVHRMYFPRCAHAAQMRARAQTPPDSPSTELTPPLHSPSDTNATQPQSSGAAHNERLLAAGGTWRSLGVVGGGARHPAQVALAARLATFEGWPADRAQTPRTLADAGFFYTGTDDQVRCFYCDGGLGRWEASDAPWSEHARWFPHCGFVLLVKGQQFVDSCRAPTTAVTRCIDECMESETVMAALGAGLDAARVRRAIMRRLRTTGLPFNTSEALIDAVLDEQLNEEAWSVSPRNQRLARDILAETLRDFAPRSGIIPSTQDESSENRSSPSLSPPRSPVPLEPLSSQSAHSEPSLTQINESEPQTSKAERPEKKFTPFNKTLTLEEENRQLKEARLCKVCMDSEVSVVFLPCGHLVSCGGCGAALAACPLCRASVRALVRAYLA
ncbi:baculoviral IAP repeat-containing protein 7-B isoform X2 [Hyposmocoma kahamanoa]|uniref:baculoviral IAP repeat-containing protein 7-B isoform X2 n=1 Tax=Hyposmocoma kahamanoa TaxID=1477025 RepID=UPI000E6D6F01|nr:baculoviral IAP repeat-containing protein 7-B isoform X2 [Hyposmocoma kahamanoa]